MINQLKQSISNCTICKEHLPLGPRPVCTFNTKSKIAIIGQAPGTKVHASGIPWDDQSGENLRNWLSVSNEQFYNTDLFAIVPMGFCYSGKGKTGDLPPRKECAPQWHEQIFNQAKDVDLFLLIGKYAQDYYLKGDKQTLTNRVKSFDQYLPNYFVLPHPSPRNNIWMKKNEWFKKDVIPALKLIVQEKLKR